MSGKTHAKRPTTTAAPTRASEPAKRLQRSAVAPAPSQVPASVGSVLDSPGQPLDHSTRADMESRFGHDFSAVRVHEGPSAERSADDVRARAYTVGHDIVFGRDAYAPDTAPGRSLLAHELAHTVQQSGLHRSPADGVAMDASPEYARLEADAESAARAIETGGNAPPIGRASAPTLSRAPKQPAQPPAPPGAAPVGEVEIDNDVTNFAPLKQKVRPEGPTGGKGKKQKAQIRKFRADVFYMPGSKGEGAEDRYKEYVTANQLRSIIGFNPDGQPRAELWEARDRTATLGESWLQLVGWPVDEKDTRWQAITGESRPFPQVGKGTAQIDHIIELQLGGTNNPTNLRPLDADPNGESGRTIWLEMSGLAKKIREYPAFGLGDADQIEIAFDKVETKGTVWPGSPPTAPWNALKVHSKAMSQRVAPTDDNTTKYIDVAAGANRDTFAVPATWGKTKVANLEAFPFNKAPAQLISSVLLKEFRYKDPDEMVVHGEMDMRNRTRIPLGAKAAAGGKAQTFEFAGKKAKGSDTYLLKLTKKPGVIEVDYPFLSRIAIHRVELDPSGDLDWEGTLTPSVSFLPKLQLRYAVGQLSVIAGMDEASLKKKSLLGFRITTARVVMVLAPEFDLKGELGFAMGAEGKPIVDGTLTLSKDAEGPVGTGHINVRLPKIKEAASDITYRHAGGKNDWKVDLHVKSEDFQLPGGYSVSGQLDASIAKGGELAFDGKLSAQFPGDNSATLRLKKEGNEWLLAGRGSFKVPKVNRVTADVEYYLAKDKLVIGTENIEFTIFELKGTLKELHGEFQPGKSPVFWGSGHVALNKGKVTGSADVELKRNGKWGGKGSVTYKFNEKLAAQAGVEIDEQERLKFSGKLFIGSLKIFDGFGNKKNLFTFTMNIPIPGASIGGVGLEARITAGADASYGVGPGILGPITISADFYPLEDEKDVTLEVEGTASIPAWARLTAYISGGIVLDAFIAEVGGEVVLEGWIELKGGLFAKFTAKYHQGSIEAKLTPEIKAALLLGLALKIHAWAKAGIGWLSVRTDKTWTLGKREVDTGLGFSLSAPLEYSTARGPKFPTVDEVDLKKPEITDGTMSRIVGQLVHGAPEPKEE